MHLSRRRGGFRRDKDCRSLQTDSLIPLLSELEVMLGRVIAVESDASWLELLVPLRCQFLEVFEFGDHGTTLISWTARLVDPGQSCIF